MFVLNVNTSPFRFQQILFVFFKVQRRAHIEIQRQVRLYFSLSSKQTFLFLDFLLSYLEDQCSGESRLEYEVDDARVPV